MKIEQVAPTNETKFANFIVERELGKGSFGSVCLAQNITSGERFAVKKFQKLIYPQK